MLNQINISIFIYLYLNKALQIDSQYKNINLIKIIINYRSNLIAIVIIINYNFN